VYRCVRFQPCGPPTTKNPEMVNGVTLISNGGGGGILKDNFSCKIAPVCKKTKEERKKTGKAGTRSEKVATP